MTTRVRSTIGKAAERFLFGLSASRHERRGRDARHPPHAAAAVVAELIAADLLTRGGGGALAITAAGHAYIARAMHAEGGDGIDAFTAQHLALARREVRGPHGALGVTVDDAESPLTWLARRKGRDGRALIEPDQLLAGERLRLDFTRAQLMPRVTSNWQAAVAHGARDASGGQAAHMTDALVAARQRLRIALDAVGPEFSGLLVDVCCFLKRLEDVERERQWPLRSAKIVLQLGLDRLARHYGLGNVARGAARSNVRTWLAPDAAFVVDGQ